MDQNAKKPAVRRIAANKVHFIPAEACYTNHVIELTDGILTSHYPLLAEQAMTEWYDGTILVDETLHIQLQ